LQTIETIQPDAHVIIRKDVGAECRHNNAADRPVAGLDLVCSRRLSRLLDPSPVSKHDARFLWKFLTSGDLWPLIFSFKKWALNLWETFISILSYLRFFVFKLWALTGQKERRADRRTGTTRRPNAAYWGLAPPLSTNFKIFYLCLSMHSMEGDLCSCKFSFVQL